MTGEGWGDDGDLAIADVIDGFRVDGSLRGWRPVAGGHIHRNLAVDIDDRSYVLQRINTTVFPDVDRLISNTVRVVDHLQAKGMTVPWLTPARSGGWTHVDPGGAVWRLWSAIEDAETRAVVSGRDDAYEAGRAFGSFLMAMDDLPSPPLPSTIEGFHDLRGRLAALLGATSADRLGRMEQVTHELGEVFDVGDRTVALLEQGPALPIRYVHADAKVANVLYSSTTGRAHGVIDYDTVMLDVVLCDIGELLRTATTVAAEDVPDVDDVLLDLDLVAAVASGFVTGCEGDLVSTEVDAAAVAGEWLAIENAARFLTDHLMGDTYFGVDRPGQNVDRCRAQLRLAQQLIDVEDDVRDIFRRAAS